MGYVMEVKSHTDFHKSYLFTPAQIFVAVNDMKKASDELKVIQWKKMNKFKFVKQWTNLLFAMTMLHLWEKKTEIVTGFLY